MILAKRKYNKVDPDELILSRVKSGLLFSMLILVPTNRKRRSLKKELIRSAGGKVTGRINIDTIGTFSQKIYNLLDLPPMQFLSEAAAAVLMKKSFSTASLKYFNRYKSEIPSGTLSRIKNIISEYKRHGISPDHLYSEASSLPSSEKLKAEDIAQIYTIYNDECKKSSAGETGDIYSGILEKNRTEFTAAFTEAYPEVNLVIVNGFDEFTAPEVNLISMISDGEQPELFIIFDYYNNNPGLFSHLKECYERFTSKGFYIVTSPSGRNNNKFKDIISKDYFSGTDSVSTEDNYNITELIALNREKEVELIAKEIKELLSSGESQPDKICVAFNLIQNYSPVVRDKFTLYNLPFNLTDRIPLSSAGPVTAIISFLEIIENDFFYKNIFRALSSGYIKLKDVSLSGLIISASELKIISGCDNWIITLDEAVKSGEKRKVINYESALTSIKNIKEILTPLKKNMSVVEFRSRLFSLFDTLNIPQNILSFKDDTEIFFKSLSAFYDTLSELLNLIRKEYGDKQEFSIDFYLDNIRTATENTRFNIIEKSGFGVQITNLNEIRGLSFDYLFIGGMMDGELPTRYTPEIFFSGAYLREEWKHQVEERYRFYQSLCAWEKGLYLSHSLQDENKELAESNFLSELKTHFNIREKKETDYSETIYSSEELQTYAGSNINSRLIKDLPGVDAEHINSLIEVHRIRTESDSESEYNGFISSALPEEKREILEQIKEKEFSASQLEIYASCPFKYFLERVLYLNVTEEPSEDMEYYELGNLFHNILHRVYRKLNDEKLVLYNCNDQDFLRAEEIMFTIADEVINESASKSPLNFLELERLKGFNGDRRKSVLFNFLKAERENNSGYTPYDFEVPFGNIESDDGRETVIKDFYSGSVKLRGKIDRIDIDHSGSRIRVTDYKLSGKKPTVDDLNKGLSLQLPLYLYAAKQIVEKQIKKEFNPAGADIYSLKYQKKNFGRKPVISDKKLTEEQLIEEYEKIISICQSSIDSYVTSISEGVFHPSNLLDREKRACSYCSFNSVCRIEENR
jgi:ATP-dependent helicase/nuclease subunit B